MTDVEPSSRDRSSLEICRMNNKQGGSGDPIGMSLPPGFSESDISQLDSIGTLQSPEKSSERTKPTNNSQLDGIQEEIPPFKKVNMKIKNSPVISHKVVKTTSSGQQIPALNIQNNNIDLPMQSDRARVNSEREENLNTTDRDFPIMNVKISPRSQKDHYNDYENYDNHSNPSQTQQLKKVVKPIVIESDKRSTKQTKSRNSGVRHYVVQTTPRDDKSSIQNSQQQKGKVTPIDQNYITPIRNRQEQVTIRDFNQNPYLGMNQPQNVTLKIAQNISRNNELAQQQSNGNDHEQ